MICFKLMLKKQIII